jgi:hypothetical protein
VSILLEFVVVLVVVVEDELEDADTRDPIFSTLTELGEMHKP